MEELKVAPKTEMAEWLQQSIYSICLGLSNEILNILVAQGAVKLWEDKVERPKKVPYVWQVINFCKKGQKPVNMNCEWPLMVNTFILYT